MVMVISPIRARRIIIQRLRIKSEIDFKNDRREIKPPKICGCFLKNQRMR